MISFQATNQTIGLVLVSNLYAVQKLQLISMIFLGVIMVASATIGGYWKTKDPFLDIINLLDSSRYIELIKGD